MRERFHLLALVSLIAILLIACPSLAQAPPIAIRGKVTSLEMESNESWRLKYNAKVELQFINVSDHRVILAKRDPLYVENAYGSWENGEITFSGSETPMPVMYSDINQDLPPADKVVVLAPGDLYTTHTTVALEFDRPEPGTPDREFYPKSRHAKLELSMIFWPQITASRSEADADDFPDDLVDAFRARWAAAGELVTGEVDTEPIDVKLPPAPPAPTASKLVLRGVVASIGPKQETNYDVSFKAELELEFVNAGAKPVFILKPEATRAEEFWLGFAGVMADPTVTGRERFLTDWAAWPSISRSPEWEQLRKSLDTREPAEELLWVIPPGRSHSYHASALLRFIKKRDSLYPKRAIWSEIAELRQMWMVISLQVWPNNMEAEGGPGNPVFGRKLRARWASLGTLELGEDGIIESEPMQFALPTTQ